MSGEIEWANCNYCDYEGPINRHYFKYDINCECCNNKHSEIVWHCDNCKPKDPGIRKIQLSAEEKHKNFNI